MKMLQYLLERQIYIPSIRSGRDVKSVVLIIVEKIEREVHHHRWKWNL